MKLIYKEKSFFDEDIEVFDEKGLLIAQINKERGKYNLIYQDNAYFIIKKTGFFIFNSKILNRNDETDFITLNLKSNFELNFKENNTIFEKYFYKIDYPLGFNFHLLNSKNEIVANGKKVSITNNGIIEYKESIDLKIILFFILIRLSRSELMINK